MLTIYSKTNCPACVSATALLAKYGIPYHEVKIDQDEQAKQFILGRGFRTVPQIFQGDRLFVAGGWIGLMKMSEQEIKELLYGQSEGT